MERGWPPEAPLSVNDDHVPQSRGGTAGRINATASANARRGVPDRRLARRRRVLLWPPQPDASRIARQGSAVPDPAYPHPDTRWACGSGAKSRFRTTLGRSASSDSGDRGSGGARGRSNSFCSRSVSERVDRPRTRTKSALLPRFGHREIGAYPAGSPRLYCRQTSGMGGRGGARYDR